MVTILYEQNILEWDVNQQINETTESHISCENLGHRREVVRQCDNVTLSVGES